MDQRIASCACGTVKLRTVGEPIITAVCYCDDCQAAARLLEQTGAPADFHDPWGGTAYATFRDDRLVWLQGADRLREVKLHADAPTTRLFAGCCGAPMVLKFRHGWWTSVYRGRLGDDGPPCEMRMQTRYAGAGLPDDLPRHRRFSASLIGRLLSAGLKMRLQARA